MRSLRITFTVTSPDGGIQNCWSVTFSTVPPCSGLSAATRRFPPTKRWRQTAPAGIALVRDSFGGSVGCVSDRYLVLVEMNDTCSEEEIFKVDF